MSAIMNSDSLLTIGILATIGVSATIMIAKQKFDSKSLKSMYIEKASRK